MDKLTLEEISEQRTSARLVKLGKHLHGLVDEDLIILKGHLIVEEDLKELVAKRFKKKPDGMERISFSTWLKFAEAMYGSASEFEELWTSTKLLNDLRNLVAHKLESDKYERKKAEFIGLISKSRLARRDDLSELVIGIVVLLSSFHGIYMADEFQRKLRIID